MRHRKQTPVQGLGSGAFLADPPADIGSLLTWFEAGAKPDESNLFMDFYVTRDFLKEAAETFTEEAYPIERGALLSEWGAAGSDIMVLAPEDIKKELKETIEQFIIYLLIAEETITPIS